jgi:hypothetical protein
MKPILKGIVILVPFLSGLLFAGGDFDPHAQATGQLWLAYLMWPPAAFYLLTIKHKDSERRREG